LAFGAATLYAVATVAQHRAAAAVPHGSMGHVALMLRLLRTRGWQLGKLADAGALVLTALALSRGSLLAVQAVLASGVVITLVLEAGLGGRMLHRQALLGTSGVVLGVILLVGLGDPGHGRARAHLMGWPEAIAVAVVFVAAASVVERRVSRATASTAWALATAACFALDTAFLKNAAGVVRHHGAGPQGTWFSLAGFVVAATVGNVIIQRAFHLAPLGASVPTLAAAQPVVAGVYGWLLFRERLGHGIVAHAGGVAGVALMVAGAVLTARTPAAPPGALAVAEEWDHFAVRDDP
jgi:drug/metabolite transporter (DMT)-like permease